MSLADDLKSEVDRFFRERWSTRVGQRVPESSDLKLGNDAVKLEGTVLYADMVGSTALVDNYDPWFAAEIYKAFLYCAAKVIRARGGEITSYDGDRIMAVFIGDSKNSSAAETGLKINYVIKKIVNPTLSKRYPKSTYKIRHVVGIDTSPLFIARTGIRGSNDLVWVGRAANHAAKLTELSSDYPTRITKAVYDRLRNSSKLGANGRNMWESVSWIDMNRQTIYRSNWWWKT